MTARGLPDTALLGLAPRWYPPLSKEDTHGRACEPDRAAGAERILGSFRVRFRRPEGAETLERYTTGRLTELPNKNGDTLAAAVPGTSEQRRQEFLTNMP